MSDDVISTEELWLQRARTAREVGAELRELSDALDTVATANYFDVGCIEGEDLYGKLRSLLDVAVYDLGSTSSSAFQLSEASNNALRLLNTTDNNSATRLQPWTLK